MSAHWHIIALHCGDLNAVGVLQESASDAVVGQGAAVLGNLGIPQAAQPPRIDPQELTLGALIGEGGFGKVPAMEPHHGRA